MSRDFSNFNDLNKYVMNIAEDSLKNKGYEIVGKEEQKKIQEEVYDKYRIDKNGMKKEPWENIRRKTYGGLKDSKNIVGKINKLSNNEIELEVVNTTKGKNGSLRGKEIAELIEYGDGYNGLEYDYKYNRDGTAKQYLNPRPFTQKTIEELENNKKYIDELKQELKSKGLELEG